MLYPVTYRNIATYYPHILVGDRGIGIGIFGDFLCNFFNSIRPVTSLLSLFVFVVQVFGADEQELSRLGGPEQRERSNSQRSAPGERRRVGRIEPDVHKCYKLYFYSSKLYLIPCIL